MSHELTLKPIKNDSSRRDHLVSRLLRDESGQDLAEYGLLAALIAVVCIAAVTALGNSLISVWVNITSALAGLP
jgi:pilus assembly protein Flp/PilA